MWQQYINAILGLILIGVAFFSAATMGAMLSWTVGIIGLAIIVLDLWGANKHTHETHARHA